MKPVRRHRRAAAPLMLGLTLALAALPTAAVAGLDVSILYDHSADFSSYSTYTWVTGPGDDSPEAQLVDRRIKTTADAELAKRGMRRVAEGEEPDMLITYYGGIEDNLLIEGVRFELTERVVWTGADPLGVTRSYEVGTLMLDFADAETEKVIWSGVVKAKARTAGQLRDKIESAVRKVLKKYPPR